MRIGILIGVTLLLIGGIFSEGRGDMFRWDEGGGVPTVGNCSGGKECGMSLIIDNTDVWSSGEEQIAP